jgi:hypothetical protein
MTLPTETIQSGGEMLLKRIVRPIQETRFPCKPIASSLFLESEV